MDAEREVGKKIETLRVAAGLGQRDLSDGLREAGVNWSQGTLSRVENGSRPIRFTEAVRLAEILKVPIAELQPTGGLIGFLYQQALWGYANARGALEDAHYDFVSAANRINALRLVRELLDGNQGPYSVSGTGVDLLNAATQGLTRDEPMRSVDELELLRVLGVPSESIAAKRSALDHELESRSASARIGTVEDLAFSEAGKSAEDRAFWLDEVLVERYAEELLAVRFPFLSFNHSESRRLEIVGIDNAHDWSADDGIELR
ncbi:helix-turn-helix transcriptional regulator [Rhodococcus sp. 1168]|uniref:helix-turn-helix domain-containing protein n=1 Tax=Rhodococcus sp. 1168 TaxID=2018041 RepID=UPI000A0CCC84|nr:helix-turn-helix transcriptional regulator [Rhodococcus sp. 1168]ORI15791.1 hypothetical protein BJI47_01475 [Rhodococcus sp. 1168]